MALIQVTPDILIGKSTELRGYRSQHDEAMQKITNLVNGLNDIWKGDAQAAFVEKFQSMQPTFKNFSELLENYAKLMETAAKELQNTDASLQAAMKNL